MYHSNPYFIVILDAYMLDYRLNKYHQLYINCSSYLPIILATHLTMCIYIHTYILTTFKIENMSIILFKINSILNSIYSKIIILIFRIVLTFNMYLL